MPSGERCRVPRGLDAKRWLTRESRKTVLAVVHTVVSGQRLLDVVEVLKADPRVQVVFTLAPDIGAGAQEFIDGLQAVRVPWQQAVTMEFDLAVAAVWREALHEIHAPLVVIGYGRRVPQTPVPAALALAHHADRERLAASCPQALPAARVVGDPCHDLLVASLPYRAHYRRALGVAPGQRLVVAGSTWGAHSLYGQRSDLLFRLVSELPAEQYRVVALLHPNVWYGQSALQVRAWLSPARRRGLMVLPPEEDWRSVLAAADWIVGDRGAATVYGAATGAPVLLARSPARHAAPGSPAAELMAAAPAVRRRVPLHDQLEHAAADYDEAAYQRVSARITSAPGRFDRNMRRLLYKLLRLRAPAVAPAITPVAVPVVAPLHLPTTWGASRA